MGTRSNIAIQHEDGRVEAVYCHFDGYFENNGKLLLDNYTKTDQVEGLIAGGDMSSLSYTSEDTEYYKGRGDNWDDVKPVIWNTREAWLAHDTEYIEYNYLWVDGEWLGGGYETQGELESLREVFEKIN